MKSVHQAAIDRGLEMTAKDEERARQIFEIVRKALFPYNVDFRTVADIVENTLSVGRLIGADQEHRRLAKIEADEEAKVKEFIKRTRKFRDPKELGN